LSDRLRVLAPRSLDRRRFLGMTAGAAAAAGLGLSGCTIDGDGDEAQAGASASPSIGGGAFNVFSWEEYSNPENLDEFSARYDVELSVEVFNSNEEAIAGMEESPGSYDIVVPSNSYIPGMIEAGLLEPLDKAQIPNIANVEPAFLDPPYDPGDQYTVVKSWGSTGFIYDTTVLQEVLTSWDDFYRAAALPQMSGKVSALAERSVIDMTLWRAGFDWQTDNPAELDEAERAITEELIPHLAITDSYPVDGMLDGTYVLSQAFSGDARLVVLEFPERYRWVAPTPYMERWTDHWAIPASSENIPEAHAFLNFMLQPNTSARELSYHGYATAVMGIDQYLPFDLPASEMIFFTQEQLDRMLIYEVPETEERRNEIVEALIETVGVRE
jgi:spermidine/putrescine transport system substrate-binding protein